MARGKPRTREKAPASRASAPTPSAAAPGPWRLRYSPQILADDLREIGHDAYDTAKKAIKKKLPVDPHQYGDRLGPPLVGLWKLKASHIRVAYHIQESVREVWVLLIGDRDVIWDRHEDEILGRLDVMREQAAARATGSATQTAAPRRPRSR
jgi:mRNA-degrading endonuclease RelE of RelBE toxin-antitoxin system